MSLRVENPKGVGFVVIRHTTLSSGVTNTLYVFVSKSFKNFNDTDRLVVPVRRINCSMQEHSIVVNTLLLTCSSSYSVFDLR